jgi:hypothetical protein
MRTVPHLSTTVNLSSALFASGMATRKRWLTFDIEAPDSAFPLHIKQGSNFSKACILKVPSVIHVGCVTPSFTSFSFAWTSHSWNDWTDQNGLLHELKRRIWSKMGFKHRSLTCGRARVFIGKGRVDRLYRLLSFYNLPFSVIHRVHHITKTFTKDTSIIHVFQKSPPPFFFHNQS